MGHNVKKAIEAATRIRNTFCPLCNRYMRWSNPNRKICTRCEMIKEIPVGDKLKILIQPNKSTTKSVDSTKLLNIIQPPFPVGRPEIQGIFKITPTHFPSLYKETKWSVKANNGLDFFTGMISFGVFGLWGVVLVWILI